MASPGLAPLSVRDRRLARLWHKPAFDGRKKPANLLYDVDDVPPLSVRAAVSLQHVFLMSLGWLYVVVVVNSVGGSADQAASIIRMSMLAGGIATILQASRTVIGSGYLCPLSGSLTYLQPSILAARTGGFGALFGMISLSGLLTALFSRFTARLRILFPPEVTGLMVSMSGLQLVALGCPRFAGYTGPGSAAQPRAVLVGIATLTAMISATVWHRGKLHVLPLLVDWPSDFRSPSPSACFPGMTSSTTSRAPGSACLIASTPA